MACPGKISKRFWALLVKTEVLSDVIDKQALHTYIHTYIYMLVL